MGARKFLLNIDIWLCQSVSESKTERRRKFKTNNRIFALVPDHNLHIVKGVLCQIQEGHFILVFFSKILFSAESLKKLFNISLVGGICLVFKFNQRNLLANIINHHSNDMEFIKYTMQKPQHLLYHGTITTIPFTIPYRRCVYHPTSSINQTTKHLKASLKRNR